MNRMVVGEAYLEITEDSKVRGLMIGHVNQEVDTVAAFMRKYYLGWDKLKKLLLSEAVAEIENFHLRAVVQQQLHLDLPVVLKNIDVKVEPFRRGGFYATASNNIDGDVHQGATISFVHHTELGALDGVKDMARKLWLT